jgi:hypothetical protein
VVQQIRQYEDLRRGRTNLIIHIPWKFFWATGHIYNQNFSLLKQQEKINSPYNFVCHLMRHQMVFHKFNDKLGYKQVRISLSLFPGNKFQVLKENEMIAFT